MTSSRPSGCESSRSFLFVCDNGYLWCPPPTHPLTDQTECVCVNQVVTTKQGQDLADEFGIKFFETSAKSNLNIDEAFRSIAVDIQKRLAESEHDRLDVANGSKFRVDETQDQPKDGCCN